MAPKYKLFSILFAVGLLADQATKIWARAALKPIYPGAITVISGYWDFRYAENRGSAFSLIRNSPLLLGLIGLVALGAIGYYLYKAEPARRWGALALGLVAAGAVGNLIDRLFLGAVTDFVVWKIGTRQWPTFNVADAALLIGVALLLIEPKTPARAAVKT